jgi:hypothetical protein
VTKKDIVACRAKQLSDTECVCPACLPRSAELECKRSDPPPVNEYFVALVAAAQDDDTVRGQILSLAKLDSFNRQSMLNTLLSESSLRGAPHEFTQALECLKDDDIARKVIEILE